MCFKCLVSEALKEIGEEPEKLKVSVGVISPALLAEFNQMHKDKELTKLDLDIEVLTARRLRILGEITDEQVAIKQDELDAKVEAANERHLAAHVAVWGKVYEELGIEDKARGYTINEKSGEVTTRPRRSERAGLHVH